MNPHGDWETDILGDGYRALTLPLGSDGEGPVVATLVERVRPVGGPDIGLDVLAVHGWSDYFFHTEHADFWTKLGARFFALDLRKYGRSLREGQTPGFVDDLAVYDADIEAALAVIRTIRPREPERPIWRHRPGLRGEEPAPRRLMLVGHSTGGLTVSLWAARNPQVASGLVLNSPWLELQTSAAGRVFLSPMIGAEARMAPMRPMPEIDLGFTSRAVMARTGGEWTFNETWRPERGFRVTAAWLQAILHGHATVARGLGLTIPVLTLLSGRSLLSPVWSEAMRTADTALDVDGVAAAATRLGTHISLVRLDGAVHDVLLSAPSVRAQAYRAIERWVDDGYWHDPL